MSGMKLAKIVRETKDLKPWAMSKALGRGIQSYLQFERTAKKITLSEIVLLKKISGLELYEYWNLIEKLAKEENKK